MKPSNTGPWGCKCQTLHHRIAGDGCDECNPDMARQIEIDNAVDDALAEYRKELLDRIMGPMYEDGRLNLAALDDHRDRVAALLNENDDAE